MPGPLLTLRFDEIALRLAGFDDGGRMDGAGFTHAEWVKAHDGGLQAKPETGMSGLVRPPARQSQAATAIGWLRRRPIFRSPR
jgi:hypothetical protein